MTVQHTLTMPSALPHTAPLFAVHLDGSELIRCGFGQEAETDPIALAMGYTVRPCVPVADVMTTDDTPKGTDVDTLLAAALLETLAAVTDAAMSIAAELAPADATPEQIAAVALASVLDMARDAR